MADKTIIINDSTTTSEKIEISKDFIKDKRNIPLELKDEKCKDNGDITKFGILGTTGSAPNSNYQYYLEFGTAFSRIVKVDLTKVGRTVTLSIPDIISSTGVTGNLTSENDGWMPIEFRPVNGINFCCCGARSGAAQPVVLYIGSNGNITVYGGTNFLPFKPPGDNGIYGICVTWITAS